MKTEEISVRNKLQWKRDEWIIWQKQLSVHKTLNKGNAKWNEFYKQKKKENSACVFERNKKKQETENTIATNRILKTD